MRPTSSKGFTLIEIMIVIGIILILSTLGLGSYRSSRQAVTLDLEIDKLVSTLHSYETQVGATSASRGPQCIQAVFKKDTSPEEHIAPYKNMFDGCDWGAMSKTVSPISLSTDITTQNTVSVSFTPPSARMKLSGDLLQDGHGEIIFALKNNPLLTRKILLNPATGTIEKIKP